MYYESRLGFGATSRQLPWSAYRTTYFKMAKVIATIVNLERRGFKRPSPGAVLVSWIVIINQRFEKKYLEASETELQVT